MTDIEASPADISTPNGTNNCLTSTEELIDILYIITKNSITAIIEITVNIKFNINVFNFILPMILFNYTIIKIISITQASKRSTFTTF